MASANRINVLLYHAATATGTRERLHQLNQNWREEWGGSFEWSHVDVHTPFTHTDTAHARSYVVTHAMALRIHSEL